MTRTSEFNRAKASLSLISHGLSMRRSVSNRNNGILPVELLVGTNCGFLTTSGATPKNLLGAGSFYASRHFDDVSFQHLNFGF
jgi:hypothetical protein